MELKNELAPLDDTTELAVIQRLRRWEHRVFGTLVVALVLNVSAAYFFLAEVEEQAVSRAEMVAAKKVTELGRAATGKAERHQKRIEQLYEDMGELASGVGGLQMVRYELESLSQARAEIEELRRLHALLAQNASNLEGVANYLASNTQFHDAVVCAAMNTADLPSVGLDEKCGVNP